MWSLGCRAGGDCHEIQGARRGGGAVSGQMLVPGGAFCATVAGATVTGATEAGATVTGATVAGATVTAATAPRPVNAA